MTRNEKRLINLCSRRKRWQINSWLAFLNGLKFFSVTKCMVHGVNKKTLTILADGPDGTTSKLREKITKISTCRSQMRFSHHEFTKTNVSCNTQRRIYQTLQTWHVSFDKILINPLLIYRKFNFFDRIKHWIHRRRKGRMLELIVLIVID